MSDFYNGLDLPESYWAFDPQEDADCVMDTCPECGDRVYDDTEVYFKRDGSGGWEWIGCEDCIESGPAYWAQEHGYHHFTMVKESELK